MSEPVWIEPEAVLQAHALQLAEHGGQDGLRDAGLLDSALSRQRNLWVDSEPKPDVAAFAAAYAFRDGDKRIATVVSEAFLDSVGAVLVVDDDELFWGNARPRRRRDLRRRVCLVAEGTRSIA